MSETRVALFALAVLVLILLILFAGIRKAKKVDPTSDDNIEDDGQISSISASLRKSGGQDLTQPPARSGRNWIVP